MRIEELQQLGELWGPSGREDRVRTFLREALGACSLESTVDPLGSLSVRVGSGERRLLVGASMDQPFGFANALEKDGRLRISLQGPAAPLGFLGGTVEFASGLRGVVGSDKSPHGGVPEEGDLFVAVGTSSAAETEALVTLGNPAVRRIPWLSDGQQVAGSDLWCRGGCAILLELCRLWPQNAPWTLEAVFAAHGVLSGRGLSVALRRHTPDACVVLEGLPATPGGTPGTGALLGLRGASGAGDPALGAQLEAAAARASLSVVGVLSSLTHPLAAGVAASATGVPWAHLGFAVENWGAGAELCRRGDLEAVAHLLKAFAEVL